MVMARRSQSEIIKEKEEEIIEAVGYVRQSEERDDKEDISEKTQLLKIQQYCDLQGWKLVESFRDIDYSGFRIPYTKRPGLMDCFRFIKENRRVKKFVVFNLSRLTRRRKDFLLIHETLESLGVDICSTAELLDFGSPTGRLVANVLVNFNEYYSDNLSQVTVDNKTTNAEKGRWNGGPAPYGLIKKDDVFVEDTSIAESECIAITRSELMSTMFQMAKEGKGPFRISRWTKEKKLKTETGVEWSPRRVRYVLTNPTYAAMQLWGGKYYPLKDFAKIVEFEDFLYIQDILFGKNNIWKGKERQLLTTLLRCPICDSKMYSRKTTGNKARRYVCVRKNDPGSCESPNIDLETLNESVINLVTTIAKERYPSQEFLKHIGDEDNKERDNIFKLQQEYDRLEEAKQNIFDDYYVNEKLTEIQFQGLFKRYESRQAEIQKLMEKTPIPLINQYGDFNDILDTLNKAIDYMEEEEKRKFIALLIEKIIPDKKAKVFFRWGDVYEIPITRMRKGKRPSYYY